MDFLIKCSRDVDEDTEIVIFEVISLYTSIPHEIGLEAKAYFVTKYQEDLHPRFRKEFVLKSANFILTINTLKFDSKFYLQIKGTAMGTIFERIYANLTMGYHEIKVYSIICQSFSQQTPCKFVFRYLDDCQILLKVNLIKTDHLLSVLNQINYTI